MCEMLLDFLVTREVQMTPTMRFTAYLPERLQLTSVSEDVEPWNSHAPLRGVYNGIGTLEKVDVI